MFFVHWHLLGRGTRNRLQSFLRGTLSVQFTYPYSPDQLLEDLMWLILTENSFTRHSMGTKMEVAFSVIFIVHLEKQLLNASLYKPFLWKRFIDDIFSVWTISETEINKILTSLNSFHATIKVTHEMSSKQIVSLKLKFLNVHDSFKEKYLMLKHILGQQKHFSTRISSPSTLSVLRRAL